MTMTSEQLLDALEDFVPDLSLELRIQAMQLLTAMRQHVAEQDRMIGAMYNNMIVLHALSKKPLN